MKDIQLHQATVAASKREKSATLVLLKYLIQINVRRVYVELGHSTLQKYVVAELGYSPAEAWTRIQAMRLISESKIAEEKISSGELTLSNAALINQHKDGLQQPMDQIIKEACGKSHRELEDDIHIKLGRPKREK